MVRTAKAESRPRRAVRPTRSRSARAAAPAPAASDSTRDKILATALRVFAERGFDGARTRDIAREADANLGLITYYFGNKETLWREAVSHAFAELQADLAAVSPSGDARVQLEQLGRRFVRFVARRPEFMCLMNDEGKRDSPRMRWLADHFVRPMSEVVRAQVERAQAQGFFPGISPVSLHYIVVGAAGLIFSEAPECRYMTGVDPTDPEFAEQHAEALIRVLVPKADVEARSKRRRAAR
jgi:TetR/AcrR family transcriptional regulator